MKMKVAIIFLSIGSCFLFKGVSSAETVSMTEGYSVTLHTGVKNIRNKIKWYYNGTQISGDLSKFCTDVQCNEGTERFRDRLKLDHQTGSLTITHTTTEDSGEYKLCISRSSVCGKTFIVSVHGVSAAEGDKMKRKSVKEGESVTLHSAVMKNTNDGMMWYFDDVLITEIPGDQSQICADDQCNEGTERFRDRLKLDHQTGSLTITNTTTEDSGEYKLKITSGGVSRRRRRSISISRVKSFEVTVTGSGLSAGAVAGILIVVLLVSVAAAAAGGIYYGHRSHTAVPQNMT